MRAGGGCRVLGGVGCEMSLLEGGGAEKRAGGIMPIFLTSILLYHTKDYFLFGQFHGMTSVLGIAAPRTTHLSTVHSVSTIFNFIHLISAMAMHIVDFGLANARSKGQAERHERRQQGQLMKRQQYNK